MDQENTEPPSYANHAYFFLDLDLDLEKKNDVMILSGGLLILAYILSLLVSYLHIRVDSVVNPLTNPQPGTSFSEYVILIKTSIRFGSSLDSRGRVSIQLKGSFADSPTLLLSKGKNIDFFLQRGSTDIFVYHSPYELGEITEILFHVANDFPFEVRDVVWNRYGILKALCLFHPWISMFHCPVRLGMYNTFVHAIMSTGPGNYAFVLLVTSLAWAVALFCEIVLRNTIPKFGAAKYSYYQGLVEPVKSIYGLHDFVIDYNWDKIRPLVLGKTITVSVGSQHPSCYSIFPIAPQKSIFNLWGLLGPKEERESSLFLRTLDFCALPLPMSMMWLAIEAAGLKEYILIKQAVADYKSHFCVFDTWLRDWPLKYPENPRIAGFIISHIIIRDLENMIKLKKPQRRATMAQVCVHQWHGLLCCLFIYIILQVLEEKGSSVSALNNFIFRTITKSGKRSPREIKAIWKLRSDFRKEHGQILNEKAEDDDVNTSARRREYDGIAIDEFAFQLDNLNSSASLYEGASSQTLPREQRKSNSVFRGLPHFSTADLNKSNNNTVSPKPEDYIKMSLATYEINSLGQPFVANMRPRETDHDLHFRHKDEISAYCCSKQKCLFFLEIHEKVGKSCLEILRDALSDLRQFMKKSTKIKKTSQIWERKEMVNKMVRDMRMKAQLYESSYFQSGTSSSFKDFECLRLFLSVYDVLQEIIEGSEKLAKKGELELEEKKSKSHSKNSIPYKSCSFCALKLKIQSEDIDKGCDDMEKLAKFFTKGTIFVSEKEVNVQLTAKISLANYCAAIICDAKDDVLMECEDPPLVMASHVMQATAYMLLTEMLPKHTDFKDMSQDELRRLGTRLQRIKARSSTAKGKHKQNMEERMKLNKITYLIEEMGSRWRMAKKENSFVSTTSLFAKALVQERIFGLTVYSGFISREHEMLLGGNKYWLIEIEAIATFAVARIARKMVSQILKKILNSDVDIDVVFHDIRREFSYCCEQVNLHLYKSEPRYVSTCCFYINDIIEVQLKEYKNILKSMRTTDLKEPLTDVATPKKAKQFEVNAKKIKLLKNYDHEDVASPMMRWGEIVMSGEPPLPEECRPLREGRRDMEDIIYGYIQEQQSNSSRQLLTALLRVRRGIDNLLQAEIQVRRKQLQNYLANVHANLTDQVAATSQAISQSYTLDGDFVREFHRDDLFNVEFFASNKLNLPIVTLVGVILLFLMVSLTVAIITLSSMKLSSFEKELIKEWLPMCGISFLYYAFVLEPFKACFFGLTGLFVD